MANMMNLVKLQQGKLIDTQVGFVESWNYLVDWVKNFCGGKDAGLKDETIYLDLKNPRKPIVRGGGGGGGGSSEVDVITDATLSVVTNATGTVVRLSLTKKKVKGIVLEDIEQPTTHDLAVESRDVVSSSEYSTTTHKFTNKVEKVIVLGHESKPDEDVFEAVEHDAGE